MELDSFKQVLLKKAEGNKNLSTLIEYMGENFLTEVVVEALEKMESGTRANGPVTHFGKNFDSTDMMQLRDAMGHHLSHYKAALKAHYAAPEQSPEREHFRQVADKHLEHMIPLMHLADRASSHSGGKLKLSYPSLSPWETNYTTLEKVISPTSGKERYKRDPKLLRVRPSKNAREKNGIPNYRYLEMPPHPGHKEVGTMPHSGGYPWEEIQLGSPADVDAKKAYLHIEDVADKKDYTPHPFDKHPIRGVQDIQADYMTPETHQKYADDLNSWHDSDDHMKWLEEQEAKETADPEGYAKRGHTKASHFYEGIPLLPQPDHVHNHPRVVPFHERQKQKQEQQQTQSVAPTASSKTGAVAPTVRKPAAAAAPQPDRTAAMEAIYQKVKDDPHSKLHFMSLAPEFAAYVKQKEGK